MFIADGYGLIEIRFGGTDDAGPELAVLDSTDLMCLDVCCKDPDFKEQAPLTQTTQEDEDISSEESTEELTQITEVEEELSSEESEEDF